MYCSLEDSPRAKSCNVAEDPTDTPQEWTVADLREKPNTLATGGVGEVLSLFCRRISAVTFTSLPLPLVKIFARTHHIISLTCFNVSSTMQALCMHFFPLFHPLHSKNKCGNSSRFSWEDLLDAWGEGAVRGGVTLPNHSGRVWRVMLITEITWTYEELWRAWGLARRISSRVTTCQDATQPKIFVSLLADGWSLALDILRTAALFWGLFEGNWKETMPMKCIWFQSPAAPWCRRASIWTFEQRSENVWGCTGCCTAF